MKNLIVTAAAVATLMTGTVAFAGPDALEKTVINAHVSTQQATATVTSADVMQNGSIEHIKITTLETDPSLAESANFGD